MNTKARTLTFEKITLHQKSNVIRLYTPRNERGRINDIDVFVTSERSLFLMYLVNSEEAILKYVGKTKIL